MGRKYNVGDKVVINYDNEILDAVVFAHINLELGTKSAYSLRIDNHFLFMREEDIIGKSHYRPWVAFFSQTGSEIVEVSNLLNRWPDIIVTNERPEHLRTIHPALEKRNLVFVENKPTEEELSMILGQCGNPLVTLHGWLRIMPAYICNRFEIYNGHPGLITKYPELKGKDPQEKAFNLGLETSGCVIHKVTEGVDEGQILSSREVSIRGLELPELFTILHRMSISLWVDFLKN